MKPFDPTKPYCRRDGKPAKIVYTFSNNYGYLVVWENGKEYAYRVHRNGFYNPANVIGVASPSICDLINVPEKIEGWGRIYKGSQENSYTILITPNAVTKEDCRKIVDSDVCVGIIPIFFTEGEGLDD